MRFDEQLSLIQYGRSIDILVTPVRIDTGKPELERGVAYCGWGYTTSYDIAMRDLNRLAQERECAA